MRSSLVSNFNVNLILSNLTPDQIADWATSANGIRVWFQNRERPKGNSHLLELAKKTQTIIVPPCGTRSAASVSTNMAMEIILKSKFATIEEYDEYVENYDDIEVAFSMYFTKTD